MIGWDGFDKSGQFFGVELVARLFWVDRRPGFATKAGQSISYAHALREQETSGLWLPKLLLPECGDGLRVKRGSLTVRPADPEMAPLKDSKQLELELVLRSSSCLADTEWRSFPFDKQEALISFKLSDPSLRLMLLREACHAAGADMTRRGSTDRQCSLRERASLAAELEAEEPSTQGAGLISPEAQTLPTPGIRQTALRKASWSPLLYLARSGVVAHTSSGGQDVGEIRITVRRSCWITILRVLIPCTFLVLISWSGFFINVKALMPRFVSGFVSFLSLNAFKSAVLKMMPENMADISWIDVFLSSVGIMMFLAVVESVMAQFVHERYSEKVAERLDEFSRRGFPLCFLCVCCLLRALEGNVDNVFIAVHVTLIAFALSGLTWFIYEVIFCPTILLGRVLEEKKGGAHGRRLREVELKTIFCSIDSTHKGYLDYERIYDWIERKAPSRAWSRLNERKKTRLRTELRFRFEKLGHITLKQFQDNFHSALAVGLQLERVDQQRESLLSMDPRVFELNLKPTEDEKEGKDVVAELRDLSAEIKEPVKGAPAAEDGKSGTGTARQVSSSETSPAGEGEQRTMLKRKSTGALSATVGLESVGSEAHVGPPPPFPFPPPPPPPPPRPPPPPSPSSFLYSYSGPLDRSVA